MRLIDAIELIKTAPFTKCCGGLDDYTEGYLDCAVDARTAILKAPDIDAIPVVRCKDCSMYEAGFCFSRYVGCGSVTPQRNPDDFCSYGERRADDG